MEGPADIDIRCSVIAFRDDSVLLVHRLRGGADDWVLPGGTPLPGESMASCARREALEETGLPVDPRRIAFVLEALGPHESRRLVDLVFLAALLARTEPMPQEEDLEASFIPLGILPELTIRPPLAGYLHGLYARGMARTAPYLGNMWRPRAGNGTGPLPGKAASTA